MIYFVVVTLSTVGFGDLAPLSEMGRVCVIIFIIIVIVLIPKQTNELIRLMGMQSVYARRVYKSNPDISYIIICGQIGLQALKTFCIELFHPDHGEQNRHGIILNSKIPNAELEIFLQKKGYELKLMYLQGMPSQDKDLRRAAASKAKACVILTNKFAKDACFADYKNIITALAIKKYVYYATGGENIRLCLQLIKPENKIHYLSSLNIPSNDQLIVIEEIKMNLLAKSCFSPGIISMISNLISSAGDQDTETLEEEWMKEYISGMGHEIYRTSLSVKFQGKSFSEVATIVYNEFQGILFGLEIDVAGQTIIRLNPGSYIIPNPHENNVHVYIICEDKKVADQVSTYEMTNEDIVDAHNRNYNARLKSKRPSALFDYQTIRNPIVEDTSHLLNLESEKLDAHAIESDYVLLQEPVSLMTVSPLSLKDSSEVINHIVVCGLHMSAYYFIQPLRAKYLKEIQYVVILSNEKPTDIWESISRFPKILFVKGNPLLEEDLLRANINRAAKAVILGQDAGAKGSGKFDELLDAERLFIYKAIKKCNKNVQIMVELVQSSNIDFLLPREKNKDQELKYEFSPLYAAGEVFISSIIDTLTCQAYFNPHIVTILQQILTGGKQSNAVIRAICDHADLRQSNLWQIPVPEDYLNKTFGELFKYLTLERKLIPLGLYRLPGSLDNLHPYVYTNPGESVKLNAKDRVFVLAQTVPNDLCAISLTSVIPVSSKKARHQESYSGSRADLEKTDKSENLYDRKKEASEEKGDLLVNSVNMKQAPKLEPKKENEGSPYIPTMQTLDNLNNQIFYMRDMVSELKRKLDQKHDTMSDQFKEVLRNEINTLIN